MYIHVKTYTCYIQENTWTVTERLGGFPGGSWWGPACRCRSRARPWSGEVLPAECGCLSPGAPARGGAARDSPRQGAGAEKGKETTSLEKRGAHRHRQTAGAVVLFSGDMYFNTRDSGSLLPNDKMFHLLGRNRNFKPTCLMKQPQDTKSNLGFTEN